MRREQSRDNRKIKNGKTAFFFHFLIIIRVLQFWYFNVKLIKYKNEKKFVQITERIVRIKNLVRRISESA